MIAALILAAAIAVSPMSDTLDRAADTLARWRKVPAAMVREEFKIEPDRWQHQALEAFADETDPRKSHIALQACAGPGKSAVESWIGWNFLATRGGPGEHPNGYAISITGDNLKDNLWKEFAIWRDRSPFLTAAFEWTAEKIFARDHPATWWLRARTYSKTADTETQGRTLSGLHARNILYLIDESGDIGPPVLRAAEQGLGNCKFGKIVQGGNPTSHDGMLYLAANTQSDKWTVIRITGDPDDPDRSSRISIEWAREQIALYGRDNPWVMAYILGKFPPSALNTLLGPDDVYAAMKRELKVTEYNAVQKRIGVDVARFGDDRTVMFPRQGLAAFPPVVMRNANGPQIAARLMSGKAKWGSEVEFIDDTGGWAATVIDQVMLSGHALMPVNFSSPAVDKRYFNKRSELHFLAAEWVKRGGALPWLPELVKEATAAQYYFDGGKLRVEEKDQIKKRIGVSPDLWDALLTTFSMPDMPASIGGMLAAAGIPGGLTQGAGTMVSDYDPLDEDRS